MEISLENHVNFKHFCLSRGKETKTLRNKFLKTNYIDLKTNCKTKINRII